MSNVEWNDRTFSRRAPWHASENALTRARRELGGDFLDLTESNPTHAGLAYPLDELAEIFARAAREPYEPDPRGLCRGREAVAAHLGASPDDLVLTASTSEAYSFLFKLLADPGDEILTPAPSYPLLDHLASLEQVRLRTFPTHFHRRWVIEPGAIEPGARSRAVVVINPNNPTGAFVTAEERATLAASGLPIISDEVFLDYPLERTGASLAADDVLTFTLGGLSKSAGLPHLKLGWIRVSGPPDAKRQALEGLELIADTFLSVATPVQAALPELLRVGASIRASIARRCLENLARLRAALSSLHAVEVLPVEGGWSAVVRMPRLQSDEEVALQLLVDKRVLVHPGYFFDFPAEGYVVVSLLTRPEVFAEGLVRVRAALE